MLFIRTPKKESTILKIESIPYDQNNFQQNICRICLLIRIRAGLWFRYSLLEISDETIRPGRRQIELDSI